MPTRTAGLLRAAMHLSAELGPRDPSGRDIR